MSENIETRPSKDGKNCTYRVYLTYYENGEKKTYAKSFNSKKYGSKKIALDIAKEHRDKMRLVFANNEYSDKRCYLDNLMDLKEKTLVRSVHTNELHRMYYEKFIKPITGNIDIKNVKAYQIQQSLNKMVDERSQDTINRVLSLWKSLYKTAIINDLCMFDMTMKVITPKSNVVVKERNKTTSYEDMEQVCDEILKHCEDRETAQLVAYALHIMYFTGIRPQEVYALSKTNVDRKNRVISIKQSVGSNSTDDCTIINTKTKQSIRDVYYPEQLDSIFDDLFSRNEEYLFKTKSGFINGDKASSIIHRYRPVDFRAYNLRHQFSTDLLKNGVDLRTVQELMGHSKPDMTVSYARSNEKDKENAIKSRQSDFKAV